MKKGFVTLAPIPRAKNKKTVTLTEQGRRFAERTVARLMQAELTALAALTPEERALYISLNDKYNQALSESLYRVVETGGAEI